MEKRSIPVCFTNDQYKMIQEYAKEHGMINASQALEDLLKEDWKPIYFLIYFYNLIRFNLCNLVQITTKITWSNLLDYLLNKIDF